jgi:TctA family transporter
MTIIELAIIQAEAKYREVVMPIILAILIAILRMLKAGERSIITILYKMIAAGLFGWLTYFITVQKCGFSYEVASGLCGVSGYLTDKILNWLPTFADAIGKYIQNKIK